MYYGFDIGGTKIEIGVFDEGLNEVWKKRVPTPKNSYEDFLDAVVSLIEEADSQFNDKGTIGIGIPGIIDYKNKTIFTTNIESVKDRPFLKDLEDRVKREIFVNNDANCFALSESYDIALKKYNNVLGIILGTGLGGGLVINQSIVTGANCCAGEIGHIRLPIDAYQLLGSNIPLVKCGCGFSGCCERYISGTGFAWLYDYYYKADLSAQEIIERYHQGEKEAQEHVDRYLELLAIYLGNLLVVSDPDVIVLGGGLSNFEVIYEELPKRLPKYLLKNMHLPKIIKAKYGDSGGTRGAALLGY